jgi:hypothetical protein
MMGFISPAPKRSRGHGYIIPRFPGVLPQTKYPVLHTLILAAVWLIWPAYPANFGPAIAVSIAICGIYLVLSYFFCDGPEDLATFRWALWL